MSFSDEFRKRTKKFAIRAVKLYQSLIRSGEADILGKQFLRSATSVAANYRAACRARSKAEFISKLGIVVEEADESVFWLEMLIEAEIITEIKAGDLLKEATEIMKVASAARKTAKENNKK